MRNSAADEENIKENHRNHLHQKKGDRGGLVTPQGVKESRVFWKKDRERGKKDRLKVQSWGEGFQKYLLAGYVKAGCVGPGSG